ncbi:unnamed protein product [Arabidopsis thaliana]|uniref:Zinc knuckle CX2CX4HX4C domain-containing protein n=1 Tax=Arabidopsis thaliana TaxID=3702 RepID=A0A654G5Z8_ARATH|nr:unnamed protein product [Arabidopsis thaliana]
MYRGLNFSINNIRKRSWVRLRNIRVNDYTKETIKEIAACVGELLKVELDLEKSQAQDYVRVQVLFDVQNPLRNSKEVQVPIGEVVSVTFDYERVRKRCFFCQIFTHDKFDCPNRQQGSLQLPSASLKKCLPERVMVDQLINPLVGMDFNDTQADKNEKEISGGVFKQKNVVVQAPMISPSRSPKFIMLPDELKGYSQAHQSQMLQVTMGKILGRGALAIRKNAVPSMDATDKEVSINPKFDITYKRKNQGPGTESSKCLKRDDNTVVPSEPSQYQ